MLQIDAMPHLSWLGIAAYVLVGLLTGGGGVAWFIAFQNRRKVPSEIAESNARAELTLVQANASASEIVREVAEDLRHFQESAIDLRDKLAIAIADCAHERNEKDLLNYQLDQCRAILDRHGLTHELVDAFKKRGDGAA